MEKANVLPELKYVGNEKNKLTLHLFFQIMGKIRMSFNPRKNHWWYITLYVNEKGFTTGPIPNENGYESFSLTLNINEDKLEILKSTGEIRALRLERGLSVANFYSYLSNILKELDIKVKIIAKPYELGIEKRFSEIEEFHHYDKEYVNTYWKAFLWVSSVFKEFSGRFYGKTCPVHLYWHSMDLAVTRFSGKRAPAMPPEATTSNKEAYSHECISFGFWAGDDNFQEPAFYSYTYPSPAGIDKKPLEPQKAEWIINNGSPMAILKYADLVQEDQPEKILLKFLESAYQAGASMAGWNIDDLKVPPLKEL